MRSLLSRSLPPLLLALHAGLFAWAVVGLIEWFVPSVPWPRLSNALFPSWLLLLHWLAIATAASVFLGGYALRWPHTARAMAASYALMASVCVIETFGFLTHPLRHVAMVLEIVAYVAIVVALVRVPSFTARFASNEEHLAP